MLMIGCGISLWDFHIFISFPLTMDVPSKFGFDWLNGVEENDLWKKWPGGQTTDAYDVFTLNSPCEPTGSDDRNFHTGSDDRSFHPHASLC